MANPANVERNRQLVALRKEDPHSYSFGKLGKIFKIKKETAFKIFKREIEKEGAMAHR